MHSWPIDPAQLLALSALLEEKHVTRAARRLGITQSSMSHRLRQLRTSLDDELLVRSGDGYLLTSRAAAMLEPLRRALEDVAAALAPEAEFCPQTDRFEVKMALPDLLAPHLSGLYRHLHSQAPALRLEVGAVPADLDQAFEEGRCSLVVAPKRFAEEHHLFRSLGRLQFGVVSSKGHPEARKAITLKGWLKYPHVVVSVGQAASNVIDDELKKRRLKREVGLIVPGFLAGLVTLVGSELLMNAPLPLAKDISEQFCLHTQAAPIKLPTVELAMIWHRRTHKDPAQMWTREQVYKFLTKALAGKFT